jgi:hypothetical protein
VGIWGTRQAVYQVSLENPNAPAQREPSMVHSELNDTKLVLVSARKSRGADHWDKDDYDVRLGDQVIGRIMLHPQAPEGQPWFWTITAREQPPSVYNRGYAVSRDQAMRYFKARYVGARGPDQTLCRASTP